MYSKYCTVCIKLFVTLLSILTNISYSLLIHHHPYPTCPNYRGAVRMRSSLGSGHTSLNVIVSDISTLRRRLKDSIASQQAGWYEYDNS